MIELGLLGLAVVIGAFWLMAALIGGVFKLVLGLFGAIFGAFGALLGGMFSILGAGIVALVVLPILALLLLPVLLPVLLLGGFVWLVVHLARRPSPEPVRH
ncbi:MAG: hypothetical protein ACREPP_11315 [Rhodanobacteraceae bacterium]